MSTPDIPSTGPSAGARFSRRFLDVTTLALVVALGLLGWFLLERYPARFFGGEWITSDHGNQLYRAQVIGAGGHLYRDVECQYGPLPVYAFAAFAKAAGNTVRAACAFHLLTSLVVVAAMFRWIARAARSERELLLLAGLVGVSSLCLTAFFRNPLLLSLGASFEYLSFERLWLIGLAAGWRPPRERGMRDALRLGLFFLLWQLTKFGGGAFGVAAFFAADIAYLLTVGDSADRRAVIRFWVLAPAACVGAEALRAAMFYAVLPSDIATRSLWPLWVMGFYPYDRLQVWIDGRHFLTYIAPIAIPFVAGVAVSAAFLSMKALTAMAGRFPAALWFPVLVPLAFYLGGSIRKVGYFGREWLFFQYAFALMPAMLLLAIRTPRILGIGLAFLAYGTSAFMFLRSAGWKPSPDPVRFETPVGPVWESSTNADMQIWQAAQAWTDSRPGSHLVVISGWTGGGWYAGQKQPPSLRNTLFVPGVRTRSDDAQFADRLAGTGLLVCQVPALPGDLPPDVRVERLRGELANLLPADVLRRVMDEYVLAETDPRATGWLLLRRRSED